MLVDVAEEEPPDCKNWEKLFAPTVPCAALAWPSAGTCGGEGVLISVGLLSGLVGEGVSSLGGISSGAGIG